MTLVCPECGGVMELHHGAIEELVVSGHGVVSRKARPATFYACTSCEHCEEK